MTYNVFGGTLNPTLLYSTLACIVVIRSGHYRQDLPKGQLCQYFVYSRADFWFFLAHRSHYQ